MKNVLITGGAGFIGSNFVRYLLHAEPQLKLINVDALTYAGSLENLKDLSDPERYVFVEGDICNRTLIEELLRVHKVDTIVHFAAESHVDRSIQGPATFVQTNIMGTFSLLEAARNIWSDIGSLEERRFHHISTDEVFGSLSSNENPFNEFTRYDPRSPYSASKAASDHLVRAYYHTYGLPVTVSNCSNNYGPYQFPEKLIPLIILRALQGLPLPVYGDGKQIRDWLFVEDHCEAIHLILAKGRLGETYNVGGGNQFTNLDIILQVCNLLDEFNHEGSPHARLMTHVPDRPGHDRRYSIKIDKIQNELNWSPRHNLTSGLRTTVEWYLDHQQWILAIEKQSGYNDWLKKNYYGRGGRS